MTVTSIEKTQAASWAQEETLKNILKEARVSTKLLEHISKREKVTDDLLKEANKLRDLAKENNKNTGDTNRGIWGLGEKFTSSIKGLGGFSTKLAKDFSKDSETAVASLAELSARTGKSIQQFGDELGLPGKVLGVFAGSILAANAAILGLWTSVSDLNKAFSTMYNSGSRFENGLVGLAEAADTVGITTGQLSQAFTQFGTSIALLGTKKATELAARFTKLNRASGELMMTNQEATEAVFEYMDVFRGLGTLQTQDMEKLSRKSREYWLELTDLSEITGRQRKELSKSIESQVKNLDLNAAIAQYSTEQQDAIQKSILQFQRFGPEVSGSFTKIMTGFLSGRGIAGLDKSLQLITTQIPGLYEGFEGIKEQMLRGEDIGPALDQLAAKLADPEIAKRLSVFAGMGGDMGAMVAQIQAFSQNARADLENRKKIQEEENARRRDALRLAGGNQILADIYFKAENERRKKATTIFTETQNKLDEMTSKIGDKFKILAVDILEPMFPLFDKFASYINELTNQYFPVIREMFKGFRDAIEKGIAEKDFTELKVKIKETLGKIFSKEHIEQVKQFFIDILPEGVSDTFKAVTTIFSGLGTIVATLSKGISFLSDNLGAVTTTIITFGGLFAAKGLLGKFMDMVTGNASQPPGGGAVGGGIGSAIGEIGKGVGTAAGGILSGVATGIRSLGMALAALGPMGFEIAAGSAAVGSAIALIGAGIAGATWIMGAALPKLTEGLKSLESVDGTKLSEVGKSLGNLSLGLTEFAGSQFATAFSGFLSIFSKLAGTDPFSVIKDMANFSSELPKLTEVSNGIKEFTESIKSSMEKFGLNFPDIKISDKFRDVVIFSANAPALAAVGLAITALSESWVKATDAFKIPMPKIDMEGFNSLLALKDKIGEITDIKNALSDFKISVPNTTDLEVKGPKVQPVAENMLNPNAPMNDMANMLLAAMQNSNTEKTSTTDVINVPKPVSVTAPTGVDQRTLQFYDEAKFNNRTTHEMLNQIKMSLDNLNNSINNQTSTLSRSIVKASPVIT